MPLEGNRKPGGSAREKPPGVPPSGSQKWRLGPLADVSAAEQNGEDEGIPGGRDGLYRQHIYSAHHFAETAHAMESRDPEEISQEERWWHRAYVSGAVFTTAAFLEASINELYRELQDLTQSGQQRLPPRANTLLLRVWPEVVGSPILHKYQVALSIADADSYDESKPPFVDADSLIRLRGALLNGIPEWDDSKGKHRTLEKRLRAKFPPNALVSSEVSWFPDRCLGAGCARWAVRTAQTFSDDFCRRMGIPARARVGREGAA
jgi:hypothetical protein